MERFDILNRHLDPFGDHFLEASAGTGKTFAIEHLVVRLLLESDSPLLLDQILVVTFTRAATRELKGRIRHNLMSALSQLQSGQIKHDYLVAVAEEGVEKVGKSIRRLEDALACFDGAQIFTIHGFCYRALSEFGFEAGSTLHLSDPDDTQHLAVIHEAVHTFLLRKVDQAQSLSAGQVAHLWRHFKAKPEKLKRSLATLVAQDREIAPVPTFTHFFDTWSNALKRFKEMKQEEVLADLKLLSSGYKQMGNPRFSSQIEQLGLMLERRECSPKEFDQLLKEKDLFLHKMDPSNRKVRAKVFDSQAVLHHPNLVEQMRKELLPIMEAASDPKQIVLRLARECREESRDRLRNSDTPSPDGLLRQMHESLKQEKFVEQVRGRYRAAIIDEFQDTDPVQWDIFQTLFVGHMRALCLVGDPKQSIYAFRNADLYTYLKAADCLGEKSRKYLDTNYRSTPPLVEALNRLFASERTKGWMGLPHLGIALDVLPVHAGRGPSLLEEGKAVHFFAAEAARSKREGKWPSESLEQSAFFPFIAQEVHLGKKGGPWSQFAILVKDRFQGQRLWDFLKSSRIPAVIRRSAPLNESDAFFALQELVEAVCFPSDLSRLKKLLGGSLIGWNREKIYGNFEKALLRDAKEKALFLQDLMFQKGFSPFFYEFLASQWDSDLTVAERLLSQGDLDLYCDLQQLAEIITETVWTKPLSKEQWIASLETIRTSSIEEDSRLKRRSRADEDAVQILTMHMSKGLEFDIVFALGVASSHPPQDTLVVQDQEGSRIVPLELDDPACVSSLKEVDAEKLRQLYVALTRAKRRVYIPLAFDLKKHETSLGQSSPIELYFTAAGLKVFDFEHVEGFLNEIKEGASITLSRIELSESNAVQESDPISLEPPPQGLPLFPTEPIVSYSALAKKLELEPVPIKKAEDLDEISKIPSMLNMPLGTQTGLIFHSIMEKLFQHGLHFFPQQKNILDLIHKQTVNTPLNLWKVPLFETIWDLLHMPFQGFSLSQIPPSQVQQEMEFLFPYENGLMKGFADLAFEWGKKYYLLDWKTNYLGPSIQDYSSENIVKSMEQHDYFLQASIYTEALKRYVKLFDNRPFSQSFGGVFYVFVRGKAVWGRSSK